MMRFLDNSIFENFTFHDGDIVLLSPPKCGAHWCMMIVYSILSKGNTKFSNIHDVIPWMEFVEYPGQSVQSRCERVLSKLSENKLPKRVLESHTSIFPGPVPFQEKVLYVITARCPFDMVVSLYHHVMSSSDDFLSAWGLDGEGGLKDRLGSVEKIVVALEKQQFPKGLWDFYNNAWKYKDYKNVHIQHFSSLKSDLSGSIKTLSNFLGVELSDTELDAVSTVSSFSWMKDHADKFNASTIGLFSEDFKSLIHAVHPTEIIRSGGVNYANEISDDQKRRIFESASLAIPNKECLHWIFTGETKNTEV